MSFYRVLGLMSGTSLDGLDIAQCIFEHRGTQWSYEIEKAVTYPYSLEWKGKLANAENLTGLDLMLLHNEYGVLLGEMVNQFLQGNAGIDFIASHGQTIFHQPPKGLTLQIGNGAQITAITGLTTICDFRSLDVARGGQGAPLVPIGDKLLFGEYDYCLNLGGFANISYDDANGTRLAYDICPVNILINHLVKERGVDYDQDGAIAEQGNIDNALLNELNRLGFYHEAGPKSLGKEWLLEYVFPILDHYRHLPLEDRLRTVYEHVAIQIFNVLSDGSKKKMLITGGGAHNKFLLGLFLNRFLVEVQLPPMEVIDFKEALIFAFLGVLRYRGEVNCLASVTGAKMDSSGGSVFIK